MGGRGGKAGCDGGYSSHGFSDITRERHFQDHGQDYGASTAKEYEAIAVNFRDSKPTSNTREFVSESGFVFKYDVGKNDFLIYKQNGEIVTMFKPERALGYWRDQVDKYGPK